MAGDRMGDQHCNGPVVGLARKGENRLGAPPPNDRPATPLPQALPEAPACSCRNRATPRPVVPPLRSRAFIEMRCEIGNCVEMIGKGRPIRSAVRSIGTPIDGRWAFPPRIFCRFADRDLCCATMMSRKIILHDQPADPHRPCFESGAIKAVTSPVEFPRTPRERLHRSPGQEAWSAVSGSRSSWRETPAAPAAGAP